MSPSVPTPTKEPASAIVVESVARELGVDPTELPEQLYSVLDPDALDSLFAGGENAEGAVTFSYSGYDVTVTAGGDVILENEELRHARNSQSFYAVSSVTADRMDLASR